MTVSSLVEAAARLSGPRLAVVGFGTAFPTLMTAWLAAGPTGLALTVVALAVLLVLVLASRAQVTQTQRRDAMDNRAEHHAWLTHHDPSLRHGLDTLSDPSLAAKFYDALDLGRTPRWVGGKQDGRLDPGAWPTLLKAEPTAIGTRVWLGMLPGQEPKDFEKRREAMAAGLEIPRISEEQPGVRIGPSSGSTLTIDLQCRDPLATLTPSPLLDAATAERVKHAMAIARTDDEEAELLTQAVADLQLTVPVDGLSCNDDILLAISEFGETVIVNLAKGAHGAVQGITRSGKSITLNTLLAAASLMRDVRVCILDSNTALLAPWWRTAHKVCRSSDPDKAAMFLSEIIFELKARESLFWAAQTDRIVNFSPELPLYLIVIDEVGSFAEDKVFQAELKKAVSQIAKYGGRLWLAGQKLDEKCIDTGTRANLSDSICHRVASDAHFRHLFENATRLKAAGLDPTDYATPKGVAVSHVKSQKRPTRIRAVFLPTEACWAIAKAIVAVRGEVRPLPGQKRTPTPELPKSNKTATDALVLDEAPKRKPIDFSGTLPPSLSTRKTETTAGETGSENSENNGTVVPFSRGTRSHPAEPPDETEDPDDTEATGTE